MVRTVLPSGAMRQADRLEGCQEPADCSVRTAPASTYPARAPTCVIRPVSCCGLTYRRVDRSGVLVVILVLVVVSQASGEDPAATTGGPPVSTQNSAATSASTEVLTAPPPAPPAPTGVPTSVIVASVEVMPSALLAPDFAAHFREDMAGSIGVDSSAITMPSVLSGSPTQELARYRPTMSSSTYGNGVAAPSKAVDGSTANFYPNVFQSDPGSTERPEWFAVVLEGSTSNPTVTVWARDCCTEAFRHQLRVSVGPAGSISLADATACGDVALGDAGQNSTQCMGTGSVIFLSAAMGGSVQLAEVSVNGVLETSGVPLGFNVAVESAQIDVVIQRMEVGPSAFGNSAAALAPGALVRLTTHEIVQYSGRFSCATALEDCPSNSNCVDNVVDGYYCECALDFTGPRPTCAVLSHSQPGDTSAGASGSIGPGSHILLQTSSQTYVRAALDGTINQVEVPATGLPDDWLFETFTLRDAGQGTVALQTYHNTFIRANRDTTIQQTGEVPAEALTLIDRDALPSNWEWCRFTVIPAGEGQVALLTAHNTFLRAPNGDTIDQSSPAPGDASQGPPPSWQQERFMVTVVDSTDLLLPVGRVVTVAGAGGTVCAAPPDPTDPTGIGLLTVSNATPLPQECHFTVIGGLGGRVSLQTSSGSSVRVPEQGHAEFVHASSGRDVALQRFTVIDAGDGAVGLQTARGTFLSVSGSTVTESPVLARLSVLDVGAPTACGDDEFLAEFFSNVELSQSPTTVLCESSIDRQWGYGGVPELQGQTDRFSVRWSGSFSFPAPSGTPVGSWEFQSTADDGSRLYVDNILIIDKWSACCTTWTSEPQDLDSTTRHRIVYEMMESDGAAFAILDWSFAGCSTDNFLVEYFDNVFLGGTPAFVSCTTGSIAQIWDGQTGVPEMGGQATNFAVRWTGMVSFAETGSYQFTSQSDDGSRVIFDGDLVLDKWAETGNTWRSSPVIVRNPGSLHSIIYEYVQYSGAASASLSWDKATDHCQQSQFWAQYFASADMSGPLTTATTPCPSSILYNWARQAPPELADRNDHFSARWMGEITITPPGSYAFISHSDDGSRVYVQGNLVLDRWGTCCATWSSDPVYVGGEVRLSPVSSRPCVWFPL